MTDDAAIDLMDLVRVAADYRSVPPSDPAADCTGDDAVNLFDLVLVATNYDAAGPVLWGGDATAPNAKGGAAALASVGLPVLTADDGTRPDLSDLETYGPADGAPVTLGERWIDDDTLAVEVIVRRVEGVYGADVRLAYDPTRLRVTDASSRPGVQVEPGPAWAVGDASFVAVNSGLEEVRFAASRTNPAPALGGDFVLVTVTFKVLGDDAEGAFALRHVELRDSGSTLVPTRWRGLASPRTSWSIHVPVAFAPRAAR